MELNKFLVEAKINTYASSGEGGERNLEDGSKELTYENADRKYRDRYFGFSPFIGEEVVWEKEKAVWGMNYYGEILSKNIDPKELYIFLQKAMRQVKIDRPFRGPSKFEEGEWTYQDKSNGDIDSFSGLEIILFKGERIFELKYHGGFIVNNTFSLI